MLTKIFSIILQILIITLFANDCSSETGPIRIGVSLPLTGPLSINGNSLVRGYYWWVDIINQKGGLLGRKVELIVYDDHGITENSVNQYRKLVSQDKVEFVFSPFSYGSIYSVNPFLKDNKLPLIATNVMPESFIKSAPNVLPMVSPLDNMFDGGIEVAFQNQLKTIGIIVDEAPIYNALSAGIIKIAEAKGMGVLISKNIPIGLADFSEFINEVGNKKIDLVISYLKFPSLVQLIKQMSDFRINPRMFVSTNVWMPDFYNILSKLGEYRCGIDQWEPDERLKYPDIKEFKETILNKWHSLPDWHTAVGAASGLLLEQAIREKKSFDREKLLQTLKQMNTTTLFGKYKLNKEGLQIGHRPLLIQWQKGRKEIIWPKVFSTSEALVCKRRCPGWPDCCF